MNDEVIKTIWKGQEKNLKQSMKLNLFILESLQKQKAQSKLNGLVKLKLVAVVLGIVWSLFLAILLYGNHFQNIYFSISIGMILLITVLAIASYIKHIAMIKGIDYSDSITGTQKKLSKLQASTFSNRFIFLQTPFYTTFFWSTAMIDAMGIKFWLINVPITLLFTLLTVWLYINLTPSKMNKKWVKAFVKGDPEHASIIQARNFLQEIEQFKQGK